MENSSAGNLDKPFPSDTLQKFVKNYGKDSLLSKIDAKIKGTEFWIESNKNLFYNDREGKELKLISKNFMLSTDTIEFPNLFLSDYILRLYGNYLGNSKELIPLVKLGIKSYENEIHSFMHESYFRTIYACLCENFVITDDQIDSFYSASTYFSNVEKIKEYLLFCELNKNCSNQSKLIGINKKTIFKELYKPFNLESVLLNKLPITDSTVIDFMLIYPIQLLAYGLYGGDINLTQNGKDLFYLLDVQNNDYSWNSYYSDNDKGAFSSTIYGLWALCEFRDQMKKLKGQLKE